MVYKTLNAEFNNFCNAVSEKDRLPDEEVARLRRLYFSGAYVVFLATRSGDPDLQKTVVLDPLGETTRALVAEFVENYLKVPTDSGSTTLAMLGAAHVSLIARTGDVAQIDAALEETARVFPELLHKSLCQDCGVAPGEVHGDGCDIERCLACGGQRLSCDCECEERETWSGEWPGAEDCRRLGFYCKWTDHGWQPCEATDEGATEDLTRLRVETRWNAATRRWEARNAS